MLHRGLWQVECMSPWCFVAACTGIASNCFLAKALLAEAHLFESEVLQHAWLWRLPTTCLLLYLLPASMCCGVSFV